MTTENEIFSLGFDRLCSQTAGLPSQVAQDCQDRNYEYRRASELLRNIRNVRIVWGKHFISVTYENERIPIKNSLPYTNVYICPVWFMGRFMTVL